MRIIKALPIIIVLFISACGMRPLDMMSQHYKKSTTYGNDLPYIVLQQPQSRVIATCYRSANVSAETCAKLFESKGYVRLRNIPYKTADYDFLRTDTYPSRRWRGNEDTPRW